MLNTVGYFQKEGVVNKQQRNKMFLLMCQKKRTKLLLKTHNLMTDGNAVREY